VTAYSQILASGVNVVSIAVSCSQTISALLCEPYGLLFESTSYPPKSPKSDTSADEAEDLHEVLLTPAGDPVARAQIPWGSVELGEQVGAGGTGVVFKGRYHGAAVALKQVFCTDDTELRAQIAHEVPPFTAASFTWHCSLSRLHRPRFF
jgi:hypothetical protein